MRGEREWPTPQIDLFRCHYNAQTDMDLSTAQKIQNSDLN